MRSLYLCIDTIQCLLKATTDITFTVCATDFSEYQAPMDYPSYAKP